MTDLLEPLVDRIEALQKRIDGMVTLRWGTVTQESPLRIRLDADEDPLPFAPATTVPRLLVGERVLCAVQHRRVIMVSVAGRGQASQAEVDAGVDTSRYVTPATLAAYTRPGDTDWVNLVLSTGWTSVSGHTPRCRVQSGVLYFEGAALRNTGGAVNNVATVPPGVPLVGTKTVFIGGHAIRKSSDGTVALAEIFIDFSQRRLRFDLYTNIDSGTGWIVPITGSILADQT